MHMSAIFPISGGVFLKFKASVCVQSNKLTKSRNL